MTKRTNGRIHQTLCDMCIYSNGGELRTQTEVLVAKKTHVSKRDFYLQKNYGITSQQWDRMFQRQKGVCPICCLNLNKPHNNEGKAVAQVDHDHKTMRVRGLLCKYCNKYKVGNNTLAHAQRMVKYLESKFDGREI